MKKIITLAFASLLAVSVSSVLAADVKANWDKHCTKCHGADGKGQTTMGKKLKVKDYTSAEEQKKFTDEEAFKLIKEGKKDGDKTIKKSFAADLSDAEIKELVQHVRKMKK